MSARPSLSARLATAAAPPTPAKAEPVRAAAAMAPKAAKAANEPVAMVPKARVGKTMVAGYFSADMARAVKMLAVERGVSVQAIIGEGLDAVLRQNGKHPFGER